MIGQTRTVQLTPEDRAIVLRSHRAIENLLARQRDLFGRLAEDACRSEGLFLSAEQLKDIQVLSDGNLKIAY
jgi:hypothetical protein